MKKRLFVLTLCILLLAPLLCLAQNSVERAYHWYAEEVLTVSNTVKQLSSEEYGYTYGPTRIPATIATDPNAVAWTAGELITDGTTGAMGYFSASNQDPNDLDSMSYIDINIIFNGKDSADFDPNDTLTGGTSGQTCTVSSTYTRGTAGSAIANAISPLIAEVHVLDNSIIWTANKTTPVYSATDSLCVGEKQFEGDTFYLFGTGLNASSQIVNFKALRSSGTDATIYIRYGR